MNIIKEARIQRGIAIEDMANILDIMQDEYIYFENSCTFSIMMYLQICCIFNIDINEHI